MRSKLSKFYFVDDLEELCIMGDCAKYFLHSVIARIKHTNMVCMMGSGKIRGGALTLECDTGMCCLQDPLFQATF